MPKTILLMAHACTALQALSRSELRAVMTEPKNALLRQYAKYIRFGRAKLQVTDRALEEIAHLAQKKGTGARGLRSIMENLLRDAMFHVSAQFLTACQQ